MELSKKVLAIIVLTSVGITLLAVAVWQNWGGLGTALAGAGGPVSKGFYTFFNTPLVWASTGGWPTLVVFYCGFVAIILGFAYVIVHYDVANRIRGVTSPAPISTFDNPMNREPQEPEPAPAPIAKTEE